MKNKTKPTRQQLSAEAITLSIAGLSCREIAKRLGTSPATISRILNKPDNSHNNSTTTTTHNTTLEVGTSTFFSSILTIFTVLFHTRYIGVE